ncbi:bifunctional 23S rRNA (guanine(2069)-N(7))-methyltransferase RlmK/23S rRNA (guanine(2445)-N(2))-methyltransferase RlmL [Aestuariicella hydrocarbonica]|uniref:Ribosomal RNA large subunit methyltransferase K/L n=1 Tax=Pseudomaricurvus hydrocarbonicus TaxID=1470433 RepID=A0A9E5JTB2_9GAMM|nr:bifunctional 23S rRNA (guanine(2069)-N(7))-methyltransferase RlmK/23S rRNA (guanine(2445)-N(2))-methyltransferase RlmL [Aestuariicella hydrocarbonica]NHO66462.1 bifunctional 23S rRNA (guanine(2069)-N(7))-methyltransferase RlmK/23S rRNA (guanine(2445)-N(2))-methyltransferase RlmL [Aestuariicella hydrocarbonica]
MTIQQFFATCPKGLEGLLMTELQSLGFDDLRETVAGVYFSASLKGAYRACLWSRIANKIFLPLGRFEVNSAEDLYDAARSIDWQQHMLPTGTLLVDFTGSSNVIRNTQFGAVKVKDAVVDGFRESAGARPSVTKQDPDLRINARLNRGHVTLSIDLCGDSLHRRGYRTKQGAAPLKENLAAALLMRAGWLEIAGQGGALIDPMCGSGTILIEAAMMALDIAPGLDRAGFGFERWLNHDAEAWAELRHEAQSRYREGLTRDIPEIRGYDADRKVLFAAESNISLAGLDDFVRVVCKPLSEWVRPTHKALDCGLILTNPPYGERLGEQEALKGLYRQLGDKCREHFEGWKLGVFTGNPDLGKSLGLRANKRYKLFNGSLPSELLLINVEPSQYVNAPPAELNKPKPLSPGAEMLANRLRKNLKQLSKWVKNNEISCYRLYDADMPEYSAAIDIYGDYVHVQEYAAPKSVDEEKAIARFEEIQAAVPAALGVDHEHISFKQRRRNRGKDQYQRQSEQRHPLIAVKEGPATLLVNLWEYLDTGLFLDHRPVRQRIAQMARGKRFLNLFCYTATATVHAGLGGARESVSVDMSNTYLKWAEKNFEANNLSTAKHQLVQGDCLQWLQDCREGFDLIMLDPPSFSNSKRMEGVLDIQRDHVAMIDRCMEILLPGGCLVFSNNLRSFKLDDEIGARYAVENITQQTLDPDFKRNARIHQCWLIRAV